MTVATGSGSFYCNDSSLLIPPRGSLTREKSFPFQRTPTTVENLLTPVSSQRTVAHDRTKPEEMKFSKSPLICTEIHISEQNSNIKLGLHLRILFPYK